MPDLSEFITFVAEKSGVQKPSLIEKDLMIHRILKDIYGSRHFGFLLCTNQILPFFLSFLMAPKTRIMKLFLAKVMSPSAHTKIHFSLGMLSNVFECSCGS
jgi:hypothetical protein